MGDDERYVRIGPHDKVMRWTEITPEKARKMLEGANPRNRTVSPKTKKKYAHDMASGNWNGENGEAIKIGSDGTLIDGHHRLNATILSNQTVWMYVVTGFDIAAVKTIDRGKGRTTKDTAEMSGLDSAYCDKRVVGVARCVYEFVLGYTSWISDADVVDFLNEYKETLLQSVRVVNQGTHKNVFAINIAFVAAFCAIEYGVDPDQLKGFFKVANTGFYDHEWQTSAITLSKQYAIDKNTPSSKENIRGFRNRYIGIIQSAIYDYVNKIPRKRRYIEGKTLYSSAFKQKYEDSHNIKKTESTNVDVCS